MCIILHFFFMKWQQSISEAEGPEYEETRKNTSSRKVVDAADRARMKAELEAIMKEEEESNNRKHVYIYVYFLYD